MGKKRRNAWLGKVILAAMLPFLGIQGCGGTKVYPLFDAEENVMPMPNDLMYLADLDGTLYAGESVFNPVIAAIDGLDGASVVSQIDIPFSGSLDKTQRVSADSFVEIDGSLVPNPEQSVFLIPLVYPGGDSVFSARFPGSDAVAGIEQPGFYHQHLVHQMLAGYEPDQAMRQLLEQRVRAEIISLDEGEHNVLRLTPLSPLMPETKYLVVVTDDVVSSTGAHAVESPNYHMLSNENVDHVEGSASASVAPAVVEWEKLAQRYFDFVANVLANDSIAYEKPATIVLAYSFTTGGTTSVLESIAAPERFVEKQLIVSAKQRAIVALMSGLYPLGGLTFGRPSGNFVDEDDDIGDLFTNLITCDPANSVRCDDIINDYNPFFDDSIAAKVSEGFGVRDFLESPDELHILQRAIAFAAVHVEANSDTPYVAQAEQVTAQLDSLLPTPKSRASSFYRVDCLGSVATGCTEPVNTFISAPAKVSQGEITLPYYLSTPDHLGDTVNPLPIVQASWQADDVLQTALEIPKSEKITYRFPFPKETAQVTIPLLAVYPDESILSFSGQTKPENGWPVIIYQHGITTSRSTALPMGDAFAFSCVDPANPTLPSGAPCFATVAIDQVLHGIDTDGSLGLASVNDPDRPIVPNIEGKAPSPQLSERHFNYTANTAGLPIPMDYGEDIGEPGSLFINLGNFLTSRDNMRQTTVDLLNLAASLSTMDIDGDGVLPDLDASRVYFIAYSLGGINGTPFVATANNPATREHNSAVPAITAATLINTGGGVAKLLENLPDRGFGAEVVLPALAQLGVVQGTSDFEAFMSVLQATMDSVDAINFARGLAKENTTGILLTEIIGGGEDWVPDLDDPSTLVLAEVEADQTIQNDSDASVWDQTAIGPLQRVLDDGFVISGLPAPLSGTEPLVDQFGAVKTAEVFSSGDPVVAVSRFVKGSHGAPVNAGLQTVGGEIFDRFSSYDVFIEMVSEITTLFASDGRHISVGDETLIEQ